jgi:hypothetical protein
MDQPHRGHDEDPPAGPAVTTEESEPAPDPAPKPNGDTKMATKKTKAPRAAKTTAGVIQLTKKAEDPEKIWHTGSKRKAAFDYLKRYAPVKLDSALESLSDSLKLTRGQVRALFGKIIELKLAEIVG